MGIGSLTHADRKVQLINQLTHTSGPFAGQPFNLRPWQESVIIRPLFATGADGRRRYRTCLLMMPRKNGKTELAAALAIDGCYLTANRADKSTAPPPTKIRRRWSSMSPRR